MQCMICSREIDSGVSYYIGKKHGYVCDNCRTLLGLEPNCFFDVEVKTPEGFVLWLILPKNKGEKATVEHAWMENGNVTVRSETVKGKPVDEVLELLYRLHDNDKYLCITCGKEISASKNVNRHIAGVFCDECWEEHKKRNSYICPHCGKPVYSCHC